MKKNILYISLLSLIAFSLISCSSTSSSSNNIDDNPTASIENQKTDNGYTFKISDNSVSTYEDIIITYTPPQELDSYFWKFETTNAKGFTYNNFQYNKNFDGASGNAVTGTKTVTITPTGAATFTLILNTLVENEVIASTNFEITVTE